MVAGVLLLDTLGRRFLMMLFTGTGVVVNATLGALLVAQPQQKAAMTAIYTFGQVRRRCASCMHRVKSMHAARMCLRARLACCRRMAVLADAHTFLHACHAATAAALCVGRQTVQSFGWPVVSVYVAENFPVSVRSAAMAATQAVAYVAQAAALFGGAALLCSLRERLFFAWSGGCAAALLIIGLLLPETKRLELAAVPAVWRQHWLWRRWYARLTAAGRGGGGGGAGMAAGGAAVALMQAAGRPLALGVTAPSEDMMRGLSLGTTPSF